MNFTVQQVEISRQFRKHNFLSNLEIFYRTDTRQYYYSWHDALSNSRGCTWSQGRQQSAEMRTVAEWRVREYRDDMNTPRQEVLRVEYEH